MNLRAAFVLSSLLLVGCATTRTLAEGPLSDGAHAHLVTVTVTTDQTQVQAACLEAPILMAVGCTRTRDVGDVRVVEIVRWADALPSAQAFAIEVHELCHAIARVQRNVVDPCHVGNAGVLGSAR